MRPFLQLPFKKYKKQQFAKWDKSKNNKLLSCCCCTVHSAHCTLHKTATSDIFEILNHVTV